MSFVNENLTILYGSQTGNAQDVAERIWRESKRYFFVGSVLPMSEYNVLELRNEKCVIFICSTTGQGEEPDNMKCFWKFLLRKNLPRNSLTNLKFAVFGLGDSSYAKYNFAAKRLNKRLLQLGGQIIIPVGLGDDQHDLGYDAAADPWIDALWKEILLSYPLPTSVVALDKNLPIKPRWSVETIKNVSIDVKRNCSIYDSTKTCLDFTVTVIDIIRTTSAKHFQDVRLIKLKSTGEKYLPGDVVVIRPRNSQSQIKEFQRVLFANGIYIPGDTVLKICQTNLELPIPPALKYRVTFQQLCQDYFDLNAVPRRHTFEVLAQLTDNALEREKCLEFTTAEGQNDLQTYCNRPKRNIVEVLEDFPNATKNIDKESLFEIIPTIKPREFSIASSFKVHKNEIHILFAVVQYKTKLVKQRLGLCSNYLANLKIGDEIAVYIKHGGFNFPIDTNVPVIMIGPGTGMASFRSYILERECEGTATVNNLIFFFGARRSDSDFHCGTEFTRLHKQKKLNLICAFSREQAHKIYVQHKIVENGNLIWQAIKFKEGHVYVAGNSKNMPQQVREAFVTVCKINGNLSNIEAMHFVDDMERNCRYQTETWS